MSHTLVAAVVLATLSGFGGGGSDASDGGDNPAKTAQTVQSVHFDDVVVTTSDATVTTNPEIEPFKDLFNSTDYQSRLEYEASLGYDQISSISRIGGLTFVTTLFRLADLSFDQIFTTLALNKAGTNYVLVSMSSPGSTCCASGPTPTLPAKYYRTLLNSKEVLAAVARIPGEFGEIGSIGALAPPTTGLNAPNRLLIVYPVGKVIYADFASPNKIISITTYP